MGTRTGLALAASLAVFAIASVAAREDSGVEGSSELRGTSEDFPSDGSWAVTLVACALVSSLANASGVGGGPLFVPLFAIGLNVTLRRATALSQSVVAMGSLGSILLNARARLSSDPSRPAMDTRLAARLVPPMLLGASIGVVFHRLAPAWLLSGLLLSALSLLTLRGAVAVVKMRTAEKEAEAKAASSLADPQGNVPGAPWSSPSGLDAPARPGAAESSLDAPARPGAAESSLDAPARPGAAESSLDAPAEAAARVFAPPLALIKLQGPAGAASLAASTNRPGSGSVEVPGTPTPTVAHGALASRVNSTTSTASAAASSSFASRVSPALEAAASLPAIAVPPLRPTPFRDLVFLVAIWIGYASILVAQAVLPLTYAAGYALWLAQLGLMAVGTAVGYLDAVKESARVHRLVDEVDELREPLLLEESRGEERDDDDLPAGARREESQDAGGRLHAFLSSAVAPHVLPAAHHREVVVGFVATQGIGLADSERTDRAPGVDAATSATAPAPATASAPTVFRAPSPLPGLRERPEPRQKAPAAAPAHLQSPAATYALVAAGGAVAASLGLGGGTILVPLLLELGVAIQTAAPTALLVVFFASSAVATAFGLEGAISAGPALATGLSAAAGGVVGTLVLRGVVRRTGRASHLAATLVVVMAMGVVATAAFSSADALRAIIDRIFPDGMVLKQATLRGAAVAALAGAPTPAPVAAGVLAAAAPSAIDWWGLP